MSLHSQWLELCDNNRNPENYQEFWDLYFKAEKLNYIKVLKNKDTVYEDTLLALSLEFGMTSLYFIGFLDGANTSLKKELKVETLKETSKIKLDFDFEKLYYNMLDAKANWLYQLDEWNDILAEENIKEITKQWRLDNQAVSTKISRNSPCPCGSGKKYKKCCGAN